jgi:hypothetical protein
MKLEDVLKNAGIANVEFTDGHNLRYVIECTLKEGILKFYCTLKDIFILIKNNEFMLRNPEVLFSDEWKEGSYNNET